MSSDAAVLVYEKVMLAPVDDPIISTSAPLALHR